MKERPDTLIRAAAIRDAVGVNCRPGAMLLREGHIVGVGTPEQLRISRWKGLRTHDYPHDLLLPAMVNAHAHLSMTLMPRVPFEGDFQAWLKAVIAQRPTDPQAIARAVREGVEMSRQAGVGWVGDIAPDVEAITARYDTAMPGVSYLEIIGRGAAEHATRDAMRKHMTNLWHRTELAGHHDIRLGLSPHAPYSTGKGVYDAATALSRNRAYRLCTHLAETPEELTFVRDAAGPFVRMLKELGKWDGNHQPTDRHPVDWMGDALRHGRWLLAHCNYVVHPDHLRQLAHTGTSIVYCPIASEFFGHPRDDYPPHPYQAMLDAGVNVCLGTDSLMCQPEDQEQPMGMLPQMRHLFRRDGADPELLLRMATTHGLLALEINEAQATFVPRVEPHLARVRIDPDDDTDPLVQVLKSEERMQAIDLDND